LTEALAGAGLLAVAVAARLADRERHRAGLPTTVTVHGQPRPLSPTVDLAAYRIVQESLTNALRYAGSAAAALVTLAYREDRLEIEIVDSGQGVDEDSSHGIGHGIAGMHERANAAGGTLHAGARPKAALPSVPNCRSARRDPRPVGRRPGSDPRRVSRLAGLSARHRGDRGGSERRAGGHAGPRSPRRRRVDGYPHAGVDGLEATRRISADESLAGVKVLILTTFESDEYVYEALRAGASGFLVKDTEPEELLHAVRVIARGDALLSPAVTRRLIADIAARQTPRTPTAPVLTELTDREREIMGLVAQGLSNNEIATHLFLSPLTVKTHVSRAMLKLGARDRAQLVVIAYQTGLANIND
jgi:DNA-binding NarL/FixJ family response regulator